MKRNSQHGVVLVITLIMLSVVTLMAVVFLAISRRERASVQVTQDQTDARLMAEAGTTRAQAEVLSRIMASGNPFNYDLIVSTNFIRTAGFISGNANPTNVSYHRLDGFPLPQDDLRQNIANLWFDPRAPVFIQTNKTGAQDFRFFLDFNRNGRFETNGFLPVIDPNGRTTGANQFFVGDPEWIGVLEHPDRPHSPTNRFMGRYAYLVLPAGKTLDLNNIHNRVKQPKGALNQEGFLRNQGFGSWEINLAAFLRDLNNNAWDTNSYQYIYTDFVAPSQGNAFSDALAILNFRYAKNPVALESVRQTLGPFAALAFRNDWIDGYSDGSPLAADIYPVINQEDDPTKPWPGSDNRRGYFDVQELFDPEKTSAFFTNRLRRSMSGSSSYDRYTFYRLLAQMGVDSAPATPNKLHLNYDTNFNAWVPTNFFMKTAERLLRTEFNFGVTNIPIYPTNFYNAQVHRLLQVAANIYDATVADANPRAAIGYPFYPSVFRPAFRDQGTNIVITHYEEVMDAQRDLLGLPWITLPNDRNLINANRGDVIIFGVPLIIGAKKGFPNFNEFSLQTAVQTTRKLIATKRSPADRQPIIRQQYLLGISNVVGLEAWNSYTQAYQRPLSILITNSFSLAISNRNFPIRLSQFRLSTNLIVSGWPGGAFFVPLMTNVTVLPDSVFLSGPGGAGVLVPASPNPGVDQLPGLPVPEWSLHITNRVQYIAIDRAANRVVDFVNLDQLVSGFNIAAELTGRENLFGTRAAIHQGSFWLTNRLSGAGSMPQGVFNQLLVSTNDILSDADWRSFSLSSIDGQDKLKQIDGFRHFLGLPPINRDYRADPGQAAALVREVPFTPSRKFFQEMKWQVNDPLVHYHVNDLADPRLTNPQNIIAVKPPYNTPTNSNLGALNERYQPWGGNTNKAVPPLDYRFDLKDALVRRSDDWTFPTNKFPSIGWLGRVHRGTPWQTLNLKALDTPVKEWFEWSGHPGTHPTNDWKFVDLFTVAPNENAARGLLSINQTNLAAWSAVLSGVPVLSNSLSSAGLSRFSAEQRKPLWVEPSSPQLAALVENINQTRARQPGQVFSNLGGILAAPALTVESPFLSRDALQRRYGISDAVYERIPQQILSLLKGDEPRLIVYAYGQSLKPADRSLVTAPGKFFNLCTNYQIAGETVVKAVIRIEGAPVNPRAIMESYNVLPAD